MKEGEAMEMVTRLLQRAREDQQFLAALQRDTVGTLKAEGLAFPPWLRLMGLEHGEPVFALVLPSALGGELDDADLEAVAGGGGISLEWDQYGKEKK